MPYVAYMNQRLGMRKLEMIEEAQQIIREYEQQGYDLTLRQLYYQFVSRDLLKNSQKEYARLGEAINAARLNGLIDWDSIVDRTRKCEALSHWDTPAQIVKDAARQFRLDRWRDQSRRVEVWIEKQALVGVIEKVCHVWDVPYLACRGYVSQSEMWRAGQRVLVNEDQKTVILYLGDHDPSGIDMTRDIRGRLSMFAGFEVEVDRLALNWDQIEQYDPPPNPAKLSDSRAKKYVAQFGYESWELDALEPSVIEGLIGDAIGQIVDVGLFEEAGGKEKAHRRKLVRIAMELKKE